jgi:hypothetical protein
VPHKDGLFKLGNIDGAVGWTAIFNQFNGANTDTAGDVLEWRIRLFALADFIQIRRKTFLNFARQYLKFLKRLFVYKAEFFHKLLPCSLSIHPSNPPQVKTDFLLNASLRLKPSPSHKNKPE